MASLAGLPPTEIPIPSTSRTRAAIAEWPTWMVWAGVHVGFAGLTWYWTALPFWAVLPVFAYLHCLDSHLIHEVLHGHPTRSARINRWLMAINLAGWVPYEIYRDSHIAHHRTDHLTHPEKDPESYYVTDRDWRTLPYPIRWLLTANNSLIGRMVFGPVIAMPRFFLAELRRIASGDFRYLPAWGILIVNDIALGYWTLGVCDIPVWQAAVAIYAGMGLSTVRSYIEHRPAENQDARTAIIEGGPLMQLLFLNNCFHLVHHDQPDLPWYKIPSVYRRDRDSWIARTGGHWFPGYWTVFKRFAVRPKDTPVFPADI